MFKEKYQYKYNIISYKISLIKLKLFSNIQFQKLVLSNEYMLLN